MDKIIRFLTTCQMGIAWIFWKTSIFGRGMWKQRYLDNKLELKEAEEKDD